MTATTASVQDRDGAPAVVAAGCAKVPGLQRLFVDGAYSGQCAQTLAANHGLAAEVVRHPGHRNAHVFRDLGQPAASVEPVPSGFVVLPKR